MPTPSDAIQLNITVFTSALFQNHSQPSLDAGAPILASTDCIHVVQTGGGTKPVAILPNNEKNGPQLLLPSETQLFINVYSENGNYHNPVIFYELYQPKGKNLPGMRTILELYADKPTRVPCSFDPLVTATVPKNFWQFRVDIQSGGTGHYGIRTLVFDDNLLPFGYFEFPITLVAG